MKRVFSELSPDKVLYSICGLFVFFVLWRAAILMQPSTDEFNAFSFTWGATYQLIALIGGLFGVAVAGVWGGWKSVFGRTLLFFSIGLLLQSFGQVVASYYVFKTGDVPYPAIDDIGFFGSVILYTCGIVSLAKVIGIRSFFKNPFNILLSLAMVALAVFASYQLILNGQEHDWSAPITTALDFGYPIFQALYVAVAVISLIVSQQYLGGRMRWPVLTFLIALIAQFAADFTFLYQSSHNLYVPEGVNDFMYLTAYFLMAVALMYTGHVFKKISSS